MPKKILFCSEAHYLKTGFSYFYREILNRLHKLGKYEIAEFAQSSNLDYFKTNPRPKWKFYCNEVNHKDSRFKEFSSEMQNRFGAWRYERVLLDFKPDIVFDMRDPYMNEFIYSSPLRPYYSLITIPTVDSEPQKPTWIANFKTADSLMVYSEWALDILAREGNGQIKLNGRCSPGVDELHYRPLEKKKHKVEMGFKDDDFIVGTVMRNQKRKLFPDLFKAFKEYLDFNPKLGENSYLYCHTSYPEVGGWDIPGLLQEFGLENKVYFSYICHSCKKPSIDKVQDIKSTCPHCFKQERKYVGPGVGYTNDQMNFVYNLFDVYVQFSICEGLSVPLVESAGCGIYPMAVDYSAMSDVIRNVKGLPLKVERMYREIESGAYRAYPDNSHLAQKLLWFVSLSEEEKKKMSNSTLSAVRDSYSWDFCINKLENVFDSIFLEGKQGQWDSPYGWKEPKLPDFNLSNYDFLRSLYEDYLHQPEKVHTYEFHTLLRALNNEYLPVEEGIVQLKKKDIVKILETRVKNRKLVEDIRCGLINVGTEDYIEFAHGRV